MDWDFLATAPMPPQSHLLHGCFLEAERADRVALGLEGLRTAVAEELRPHMVALIEEIRRSSQLLRGLADRSHVHTSRAPIASNHLNVVLPCMSRSLRDITAHYDDKTVTREIRWRKMYHDMKKEAGDLPLPQRFVMYNHFLTMLLLLLTKDKNFDHGQLELVRSKILDLRQRRGIPAPVQTPISDQLIRQETVVVPAGAASAGREPTHWAEHVSALPLVSRTNMNLPERSTAFPPFVPAWDKNRPRARRTLMRRSFDGGRLSVLFILNSVNNAPFVVVKMHNGGTEWYSYRGHHEICVHRDQNSLVLKRWSHSRNCSKTWVVLSFTSWEELVLFYCTFMALKARNELTVDINPLEYRLRGEKRLFQAQIIDDGYKHSLIVYQDTRTGGMRLLASVWEGELCRCPVWTAFITHQSTSPDWVTRMDDHLVWIRDIQLYVFCDRYHEANMRRNKKGAFEIYFVSDQAAVRFREVFYLPVSEITDGAEGAIAGPSSS